MAGLEFARKDSLALWFTDEDPDDGRREAWRTRQLDEELASRGLARLMSSDAHSPEQVGNDRATRTLTRLRLDDRNFDAIRNALLFNRRAARRRWSCRGRTRGS